MDNLYIISYLIHETHDSEVAGYADLAARILYMSESIEEDGKISDIFAERMNEFVEKTDENQLKWGELRSFIESASSDDRGSMFLSIKSKKKEPNKWGYKFESSAPEAILEDKIESLSEHDEALKQKIINAAEISDDDLYEEVYE